MLGPIAAGVGLFFGLQRGGGILSLIMALSFLWFGNAVQGILSGEITAYFRWDRWSHSHHYTRAETPGRFWFQVVSELVAGVLALAAFFYQLKKAGLG